jgi:uncharacterized protein (DUF1501 family)
MCDCRLKKGVSRRDVLRLGLAGTGLAALGPVGSRLFPAASAAPANATRLVVVDLDGGNDTLNMVAPVTLSPYHERRPGLALTAETGLSMDAGPGATSAYVLHPAMPRLAQMWAEGDVAVVNRVGYPQENLSHFTSQDIFSYGVRGSFGPLGVQPSGWVARFADLYAPTPMGAVSVGLGRPLDFAGGTSNPLLVNSVAGFRFSTDSRYPANHVLRVETIQGVIDRFPAGGVSGEVRDAVDQAHALADQVQGALSAYQSGVVYPQNGFANRMKDVAVLVQGGFETRVFYTGTGGYDTHSAQGLLAGTHADLLGRVDGALGALSDDLKAMGVWDDVVIALITEFGRRNYANGSEGTDHGHAYAMVLVGGAVNGGMHGPDLVEADLQEEYLSYAVDFRSVYKEVLSDHLGVDPAPVFPEPQETDVTLGVV